MSMVRRELIFRQLSDDDAEPVLIADFQPFSAEPRISQLLGSRSGRTVYQIDPLAALVGDQTYHSIPELAGACAEAFLAASSAGDKVHVIGYCSAAALSLHTAALLEDRRNVTAVLVRPSWPDDEAIRNQFADFLTGLRATDRQCPDLHGDPRRCVAHLEQVLRDELLAMASAQGLDGSADAFRDLLGRYRAWLAFLLACRNYQQGACPVKASAVQILTDDQAAMPPSWLGTVSCQVRRLPPTGHPYSLAELADAICALLPSKAR
jgi:hypothetical protein